LIHNEEFARKVIPFLDTSYFHQQSEKVIAESIIKFFTKYNKQPTTDIINIELQQLDTISDKELNECIELINQFKKDDSDLRWLIQKTEEFCKNKAIYNAIVRGIKIIEGKDTKLSQDAIPKILSDALAVSFDTDIGHDYIDDADLRFDFYRKVEEKISFDLDLMNTITNGGLSRKSLNVILAGTGAGKSLFMCHTAANALSQGNNVLYITLEMAEERIAERIDANLFDINIDQLKSLDQEKYQNRIKQIASKTHGKLIIKEYPTAAAHSGHFRALIEELKVKRQFIPDLLIIDYLNICSSARIKLGTSANTYMFVKAIAEELRGLAVEYNVPLLTATQTNRTGFDNSDVNITDTSESFGLPATSDLMFALIRTEQLDVVNQILIKQLKNRYSDPASNKRFAIGVDREKMKLYNLANNQQDEWVDFGNQEAFEYRPKLNNRSNDYNSFNF
jgi:archaellum biogenesis ATPase FlaH